MENSWQTWDFGWGVEGCGRKESTFSIDFTSVTFITPREFLEASGSVFHSEDVGTPQV